MSTKLGPRALSTPVTASSLWPSLCSLLWRPLSIRPSFGVALTIALLGTAVGADEMLAGFDRVWYRTGWAAFFRREQNPV